MLDLAILLSLAHRLVLLLGSWSGKLRALTACLLKSLNKTCLDFRCNIHNQIMNLPKNFGTDDINVQFKLAIRISLEVC